MYAPNEDCPEFFAHWLDRIQQYDVDHVILGGDLNVHLNPEKDNKGGRTNKISASAELINIFLEESDYDDVWRRLNEDRFGYTWKNTKKKIFSRIDYFLAPLATLQKVVSCEILAGIKSDHNFVEIVLRFANVIRGPGYWKFNNSLLSDIEYVEEINKLIDEADKKRSWQSN